MDYSADSSGWGIFAWGPGQAMAERPKDPTGNDVEGVIVEFHRIGNAVKVSAADTRSLVEVSIMAPVTASEREMTDAVLRKLAWVQARGKGTGKGRPGPVKRR